MSKWTKERFIEDLRNRCSREIAKIGEKIIEFSDTHASEVTWGRGGDHGTFTFRSFSLSSASRKSNCAMIKEATLSSIGVPRKIILSFNSRE